MTYLFLWNGQSLLRMGDRLESEKIELGGFWFGFGWFATGHSLEFFEGSFNIIQKA